MRCGCSHVEDLHPDGQGCTVTLPADVEHELPAWRCPCRTYAPVPAGVFRWHTATLTWQAVMLAVQP